MKKLTIIITCTLLIVPLLAYGEDASVVAINPALVAPEFGGLETTFSIIKLLAAFMVVAGVMALVFKIMRKIGPSSMGKTGLIKVLDTRMIAQKKYISVIRIAGQDMAVGISERDISLLCTLNTDTTKKVPEHNKFNTIIETATKEEVLKA